MTITRSVLHCPMTRALLAGALALAPLGAACAWQAAIPSSQLQYQQAARQQQTRDQLQKNQLAQQLHQDVADNARRPTAKDARTQRQLDEADRAQRARDYANQQDLLDRDRDAATLPRVIPKDLPAPPHSG
jgi:hypothetical protein